MHIPKQAKRVFKGIIYDVYHWEQELFDGTTGTFEALKREFNVTIIPTSGDKILYAAEVTPSDAPFTTFFGGKSEPGEEPLVAAKRELLEESGLVSDDWELVATHDTYSSKLDWTVYTYVAKNAVRASEQHLDPGEKITVKEAPWDEFFPIATMPNFRNQEWAFNFLRWERFEPEKLAEFKKKLFG